MKSLGLLLLVISPASLVLAEPPEKTSSDDPWLGFPAGSWIITNREVTSEGETRSWRTKKVRIDGSPFNLAVFEEQNGKFPEEAVDNNKTTSRGRAIHLEKIQGIELVNTKQDSLTINKMKYDCLVKEYRISDSKKGTDESVSVWHHQGLNLPYRTIGRRGPDVIIAADVLRVDWSLKGNDLKLTLSQRIISLDEKVKIGNRMLKCVVEEVKGAGERRGQKSEGTIKRWLTSEIPGHQARETTSAQYGNQTMKDETRVIEFHVPVKKQEP